MSKVYQSVWMGLKSFEGCQILWSIVFFVSFFAFLEVRFSWILWNWRSPGNLRPFCLARDKAALVWHSRASTGIMENCQLLVKYFLRQMRQRDGCRAFFPVAISEFLALLKWDPAFELRSRPSVCWKSWSRCWWHTTAPCCGCEVFGSWAISLQFLPLTGASPNSSWKNLVLCRAKEFSFILMFSAQSCLISLLKVS